MMSYYSHLCACGCGGKIEIKEYHRKYGEPIFIQGHHRKGQKNSKEAIYKYTKKRKEELKKFLLENYNKHICKCGCNKYIEIKKEHRWYGIPDYIKGHAGRKFNLGKKRSEETKQKISKVKKEQFLEGKIPQFSSELNKLRWENKEYVEKRNKNHKEAIKKESYRKNQSIAKKELWKTEEYVKKQMKSRRVVPNKTELYLQFILDSLFFEGQFMYVGDGKEIIGGKCPDFIDPINNKIVELYGDYWHKGQDPNDRINYFKDYGYNTLVVWESELKNIENLNKKLITFGVI